MNDETLPGNRPPIPPFTLHQVIDRQHNNVVASVFEYPTGWQVRSEVVWKFENMSFPMIAYAQAYDPAGGEMFEFLPQESFAWVVPDYGYGRPGQPSMGQTLMPPMPAVEALTRWIVPKYRSNRPGLQITAAGQVAQLAQRINLDVKGMPAEEAAVRLEYSENGKLFEEEIYGVKVTQDVPYYGPMGAMTQTNWGFLRLFAFRAGKGQLDSYRERFWHMAASLRANPLWEQLYNQVLQQLQVQFNNYIQMGYNQIQAAGQLSRAISANNDAWLRSFEQQRQAAARSSHSSSSGSGRSSNEKFSDYIRGVETVHDPYYGESQQDANYQYHWTDSSGNYQHSDDPFFNPNIGATVHWTLMEPKK